MEKRIKTEKRFQEYYQGNTIVSIHDKENNNELVNILQCVELLNEQHEENMLLIEDTEKHRKLAIQFDNRNKELVSENALLEKENEQLKQQLKELLSRKDGLEWLRNNTVWEQMPTDIRTFTKTNYER